jgi:hypothetical protein
MKKRLDAYKESVVSSWVVASLTLTLLLLLRVLVGF